LALPLTPLVFTHSIQQTTVSILSTAAAPEQDGITKDESIASPQI
jgi:hypothetical protein